MSESFELRRVISSIEYRLNISKDELKHHLDLVNVYEDEINALEGTLQQLQKLEEITDK